jgi:hypothetical protein
MWRRRARRDAEAATRVEYWIRNAHANGHAVVHVLREIDELQPRLVEHPRWQPGSPHPAIAKRLRPVT